MYFHNDIPNVLSVLDISMLQNECPAPDLSPVVPTQRVMRVKEPVSEHTLQLVRYVPCS